MTDTSPAPCHPDRALGYRATRRHTPDCTGTNCQGHDGCEPCPQPHCAICGRTHTTTATPLTCPECQGKVDDDLTDIRTAYALLATEAVDAGADGRLAAAAPIPGGTAMVLIGPTVRLDRVKVTRRLHDDHLPRDPLPPLAVLAQWEDIYRGFLGHNGHAQAPATARWGQQIIGPRRATIGAAIDYLRTQLPYIAQRADGPDFLAFTRQIRALRSRLEHALHDERAPESGVECFECGEELVRRFRDAKRCLHTTEPRTRLREWMHHRATAQNWLRTLHTYPELGSARIDELRAADAPPAALIAAARRPCPECAKSQGGIDDPRPGRSWECPGCRKEYTPGEYATAVRSSLVDDADGWCTLTAAASAAADITGRPISAPTIRTWIEREDDIRIVCLWRAGDRFGAQLVFWPDVLARATEQRARGRRGRVAS